MLPRSWFGGGWYSAGKFLKAAQRVRNCASPVRRRDVGVEEDLPLPFWIRPAFLKRVPMALQLEDILECSVT